MAVSKGIQTTEFALTLLVNAVGIIGSLAGIIPPSWSLMILAIANSVYGILRTIVKINDPSFVPPELPPAKV